MMQGTGFKVQGAGEIQTLNLFPCTLTRVL